jgi:hypothetical protein
MWENGVPHMTAARHAVGRRAEFRCPKQGDLTKPLKVAHPTRSQTVSAQNVRGIAPPVYGRFVVATCVVQKLATTTLVASGIRSSSLGDVTSITIEARYQSGLLRRDFVSLP